MLFGSLRSSSLTGCSGRHKCGTLFDVMGCSCSRHSASEPGDGHVLPTLLRARSQEPKGKEAEQVQKADKLEVSCHASAGAKWHLELLTVSAELKQKPQDLQFVATRCDLDGSGDLDAHELKQAARVYGLSDSSANHGSRAERISKQKFAEMVASKRGSTKLIRTIPHSLRGMALGQLQHLESLFIKTGWLAAQCEFFNAENAEAIASGRKFRQNTNLYALDTFVVTPMSKPGPCEASEHDQQKTIAQARGHSSFSELVNPFGLFVHSFVSHFWGHDFTSAVTALDLWADENYPKMTSEQQALVYWVCLFALNQHNVTEEVGENPQQGPFNAALAQAAGGAAMVLDDDIKPFSRIWCLFEISRLKDLQRPFELICSEGSLSQPKSCRRKAVSAKMLEATCQALWSISAAKAQSSVAADKYKIWAETADNYIRTYARRGGSVERYFEDRLNNTNFELYFSDFDRYMKALLSTSMLEVVVARGDYVSAAKCCLHGAHFGSEQLVEIYLSPAGTLDWLNSLLLEASDASIARLLLELHADACGEFEKVAPVMRAAQRGHEAVVKLLLEHHADTSPPGQYSFAALRFAAQGGHEAVAKMLLEHSSDPNAVDNHLDCLGSAALKEAAEHDHVAVAKLLLEWRADVNDGCHWTALMYAASNGHEAMAKLLLRHRADVAARWDGGDTALMLAARYGREAVAKLLLQHGANAKTANSNGETALSLASANSHESLARLLRAPSRFRMIQFFGFGGRR